MNDSSRYNFLTVHPDKIKPQEANALEFQAMNTGKNVSLR